MLGTTLLGHREAGRRRDNAPSSSSRALRMAATASTPYPRLPIKRLLWENGVFHKTPEFLSRLAAQVIFPSLKRHQNWLTEATDVTCFPPR